MTVTETTEKVQINRASTFIRYYIVEYGRTEYELDNILFYNENGVIFSTNHGWLETPTFKVTEENIDDYHTYTDIYNFQIKPYTRKTKADFTCKKNFIVSLGKSYGSLRADLYIYVDNEDVKVEKTLEKTITKTVLKTQMHDEEISVYKVTGITYMPFDVLSIKTSNYRPTPIGDMVEKFKLDNAKNYELKNISDYALAELFAKYELKLK